MLTQSINVEPSNRRFGLFFSAIFLLLGWFFSDYELFRSIAWGLSLVFFLAASFHPDALLPFNRIWMRFGRVLGVIFNPLILGMMYFAMVTPAAVIGRLARRDELKVQQPQKSSFWEIRESERIGIDEFKNQF